MRLYQQLILFMLAATVVPLASLGFSLLAHAERAVIERIGAEQHLLAQTAAENASHELSSAVENIKRSAELFDWLTASPEERVGGLKLAYQQSPLVSAVVLLDADKGVLAGPIYAEQPAEGHPAFSPGDIQALLQAVPLSTLEGGGRGRTALSSALEAPGPQMAFALAVRLSSGKPTLILLAQIALAPLGDDLKARAQGVQGRVQLVDEAGRLLASSDGSVAPIVSTPAQRLFLSSARASGPWGLQAVASVEEALALAPVRAMRKTVLEWVALAVLVLLGLGAVFTRRLNRRLERVVEGAQSYARGELGHRIRLTGADELTQLSSTFNKMGDELEAARGRLVRWNDDLRLKVEEATAELKMAQAQLVEAQKLAAVGTLGAGVAHEINNPLAGILGNTQLLLLERSERDPDFHVLQKIEQSAKRCKEITQSLLRFSQQRERAEMRPLDFNAVVRDAFSLIADQIRGEGVHLSVQLAPEPLMVSGDPGHLVQVVLALLSNARTAMLHSDIKQLSVSTQTTGDETLLEVKDSGKGIAPQHLPRIFEPFFTTKDVWSNVGLGLSIAYRILSEHQGKVDVHSEVGRGSCFSVRIPKLANLESKEEITDAAK